MSGGYQIIMSDLKSMSQVFEREAQKLTGLTDECLAMPDGGDGTIDSALSTAVRTATILINQLAGAVQSHGQKLASAEQRYRGAEETNSKLSQDLTSLVNGRS